MLTPLRVMIEISHHVIRYGIRRPARLRKQQASLTNCASPVCRPGGITHTFNCYARQLLKSVIVRHVTESRCYPCPYKKTIPEFAQLMALKIIVGIRYP